MCEILFNGKWVEGWRGLLKIIPSDAKYTCEVGSLLNAICVRTVWEVVWCKQWSLVEWCFALFHCIMDSGRLLWILPHERMAF